MALVFQVRCSTSMLSGKRRILPKRSKKRWNKRSQRAEDWRELITHGNNVEIWNWIIFGNPKYSKYQHNQRINNIKYIMFLLEEFRAKNDQKWSKPCLDNQQSRQHGDVFKSTTIYRQRGSADPVNLITNNHVDLANMVCGTCNRRNHVELPFLLIDSQFPKWQNTNCCRWRFPGGEIPFCW